MRVLEIDTSSGAITCSRSKEMVSVMRLGGWGHRVGDNVADTPPEASGAEASPLDEMLAPEVHLYVFLIFFLISHLYFRKDDCADYSCMTEEVHDEALDGQDAPGHISAEHYNYNFRCHLPSTSANPFKLGRPLAGEPQPRVRTFLWLVFVFRETCQQTCSRGDVVHSCASKASPPPLHFGASRVTAELIQLLLPTGGPLKIQTRVWKSAIFSIAYCRIFGGVLPQA